MSKLTGFFHRLLEKQKTCMAACLIVSLVSGSICAATAFDGLVPSGPGLPASMADVSRVQAAEPKTSGGSEDNSIPDDDCMYVFYSAWEGYEFKPSEFNSEYEAGDEIRITVTYNRSVGSQIASNVGGTWTTFAADGKTLEATFIPDDGWLNLQITDLKEASSVGVVSIEIEITLKNAAKLARMRYTAKGDHVLFSDGGYDEAYETDDLWLSYCDDTDWLTLAYDCSTAGQEGWGILGWGGSLNGEWINGPGYGADKKDSTTEVSVNFSVKYLRKMMHLTKSDEMDFTSLGAWSGGRIKSLVLHRGSLMPRSDILFENGAENEEWVCKDIEQILDEDGSRFLCLKYTCSDEENYGWSVMGFGAGVDGEWKSGRSFKVSEYQPTRDHYDFMTVDQFRASMGLSWDVKVDSISLGAYNQGRILKLWLSDKPALDPGDDVEFEEEWESPNAAVYKRVAYADGTSWPQSIRLQEAWAQEHPVGEREIIESMGRNTFIVVSYHSDGNETPTLYITMKDNKQSHVKAVWSDGKKAVYSYDCIARMFPGYLIPEEIDGLAVSTGEKPMTISEIRAVVDNTKLEEEPIAVLTSNWSGFETEISKYHSGYEPGDTVRVTVRFDKVAPGTVAFHIDGNWNAAKMQTEREFSVTATPDDDYMSIQIGEIPRTKEYVMIRSIRVDIVGKPNYTSAVVERGSKTALLAQGARESAKAAGLTDAEVESGRQLIVTSASASLTGAERAKAQALLDTYAAGASGFTLADCTDITLALSDGKTETPLHETPQKLRFKVAVPSSVDGSTHDFGVIRLHGESADLLPDVDDEDATITFESDRFSRFVIVCGPKDCFKDLRGDTSIHTFIKAWNSWDIKLNDYIDGNVGFGAGDTVKITVEFNKNTSSEINTNVGGTWTKLGGAGNSSILTVTGKPDGDTVALQITDLLGEKSVKVMKVKVEITESAPLPVFTREEFDREGDAKVDSKSITLNKFLKDFKAGVDKVKITVNLSSDGAFKGNLEGNSIDKTGTGWHSANGGNGFESENNRSTFTWITIPRYGEISVKLSQMEGTFVRIDSVTVERTEEEDQIALPVFKKAESKSLNLASFLNDLVPGSDYVKVTVKLSSDGSFKGKLEGNSIENGTAGWNSSGDYECSRTGTFTWSTIPQYSEISLTITEMTGSEVRVESVTVERSAPEPGPEPEEPEQVLFTLKNGANDIDLSKYNPDYRIGDEVKVTMAMSHSDEFTGKLVTYVGNSGGWTSKDFSSTNQKCSLEWTVTPFDERFQIEVYADNVNVTEFKVEITKKGETEEPAESIHEFKGAWSDGEYTTTLSEWMETGSFAQGAETTLTLTFDRPVKLKLQSYGGDVEADSAKVSGTDTVTVTIQPAKDELCIQLRELPESGSAKLLSVEVTQNIPSEGIYEFTKLLDETFDTSYSVYLGEGGFIPEMETTVTLTFDREVGSGKLAYHAVEGEHDWTGMGVSGTGNVLSGTITPYDDYLGIQIGGGNPTADNPVKLLKAEITQNKDPEGMIPVSTTWNGVLENGKLSAYLDNFVSEKPVTVIMIFDRKDVTAIAGYNTASGFAWSDGSAEDDFRKTVTITPSGGSADYLNVAVSSLGSGESVNLLKVYAAWADEAAAAVLSDDISAEDEPAADAETQGPTADENAAVLPEEAGEALSGPDADAPLPEETESMLPGPDADDSASKEAGKADAAVLPEVTEGEKLEEESADSPDDSENRKDVSGETDNGDGGSEESDLQEDADDALEGTAD